MQTEQITQRLALGNGFIPQTLNNATATTTGIDMQQSRRAMFILSIGANAGSLTAKLQESNDNSSFTDLAGSNVSLPAMTSANKIYSLEVNASQITKRYVRMSVTEGNSAAVVCCAVAFGDEGEHKPNNANNGTNVTTQNVVA